MPLVITSFLSCLVLAAHGGRESGRSLLVKEDLQCAEQFKLRFYRV